VQRTIQRNRTQLNIQEEEVKIDSQSIVSIYRNAKERNIEFPTLSRNLTLFAVKISQAKSVSAELMLSF